MKSVGIGIMSAVMGLYALSGWAQEFMEKTANPALESSAGASRPYVNDAPATTKGKGADHQSLNAAPAISQPSGLLSPTDKVVARFMALDADTSGGVSFEEYMTMVRKRAEARYAAMDANKDGEVSNEEYRAFWKSRMAQWYRLKR